MNWIELTINEQARHIREQADINREQARQINELIGESKLQRQEIGAQKQQITILEDSVGDLRYNLRKQGEDYAFAMKYLDISLRNIS
jgi:uncharacterized coiled-coil DUF342 family protein